MKPTQVLAALTGFLCLIGFGCNPARPIAPLADTPQRIPVTFQTNWYAEADHGGYYQALAKGFYTEVGLDVTLNQGGPGALQVQKVATGQAQFALGRSDDVILAVQEGLPVVMVSAQLQHDPQTVMIHESDNVHGFADLDGRSIMVETGSAWLTYVERKFGITIKTIPVNYGLGNFIADQKFLQQGFLTNEPYIFEQQGIPIRSLLVSDSGYDPYRVVLANKGFVKRHPDAVRAFVQASIRGWHDYLYGDPSPGDALIAQDYEVNTPGLLDFARKAMAEHQTAAGDQDKGERLGLITRQRMAEQIQILAELGLLTKAITVDEIADFRFLPDDLRAMAE